MGIHINEMTRVHDGAQKGTQWHDPLHELHQEDWKGRFEYALGVLHVLNLQASSPGLGVVVVGSDGVVGSRLLPLHPEKAQRLIIGRHGACDLPLFPDPAVSLRHVCILGLPRSPSRPLAYRVLDLRSEVGLTDHLGVRFSSVEVEGVMAFRCSHFSIFCMPLEASKPIVEDAEAAWQRFTTRRQVIRMDEPLPNTTRGPHKAPPPNGFQPRHLASQPRENLIAQETLITILPSVERLDERRLLADEDPMGVLIIDGITCQKRIRVGAHALRSGILLGRYDRCDASAGDVLICPSISRVHLLILMLGQTLWAIDTSSTNHTFCDLTPVEITRVTANEPLVLGRSGARVKWTEVI